MCTRTYDSNSVAESLFGTMFQRISTAEEVGLVVMTISSTNGSTLFDSGILLTSRSSSLWFSFYSNLTLILDDFLAKYLLCRI